MKTGFTLVETLVTITIIAVIGSLATIGSLRVKEKAAESLEVSAARNLMNGYIQNAADNGNRLMVGVVDTGEVHERNYPWRLEPDVGDPLGNLLFNGQEKKVDRSSSDFEEQVSEKPNMGMNVTFVGGDFGADSLLKPSEENLTRYGQFCVTRMSGVHAPERLIVFASARHGSGNKAVGNAVIIPPSVTGTNWSSKAFEESSSAESFGNVDFRWKGKAVVAMLDGGVVLMTPTNMRDMRKWSDQASRAEDVTFTVAEQN